MKPASVPVVVAAALLASGCLQASEGPKASLVPAVTIPDDWDEIALPFGAGHDHFDAKQHQNLSTANFHVMGWDPLVSASKGVTAGGYFCGEARTRSDGRVLAVVNSFYSGLAFVLADVTDPNQPFYVGEFSLPQETVYDVAMTPDGRHVVVGANPKTSPPSLEAAPGPSLLYYRDACDEAPRAVGPVPINGPSVILVGINDPAHPVIEDVVPMPVLGPHSVSTALIDGTTYVAVSVTNLQHQGSYYAFYTEASGRLTPKWVYQAPPPSDPSKTAVINGHVDATLAKHPVTGHLLAYLADWDAGMVILDLSGPVPMQLSSFSEYSGGGGSYQTGVETGNMHDAIPIDGLWDGRHYVIAGQEIVSHPKDHPSGWVYVIDDTDPSKLSLVGRWVLPVDAQWSTGLQFSTHYIALVNRTAFVSMYHGGVWAIDLSSLDAMKRPAAIGAFIPAYISPKPGKVGGGDVVGTPTVMEAWPLPSGPLVVFDSQSGVYVVHFDASNPAPPKVWEGLR